MSNTAAQHTPGPWRVTLAAKDQHGVFRHQIGTEENSVAYTWLNGEALPSREHKANARLIAAAPDLLYALRELFAAVSDYPTGVRKGYVEQALKLADAAINKAVQQ